MAWIIGGAHLAFHLVPEVKRMASKIMSKGLSLNGSGSMNHPMSFRGVHMRPRYTSAVSAATDRKSTQGSHFFMAGG
jgi:hypothetical protein